MSCVIGLKYNGNIYMGADGRASTLDGEIRPVITKKIFKNGKYLIGYTGSVRSGQVLLPHYFKPPNCIDDFPDAIREQLAKKGCLSVSEDQADSTQTNFLVATKNHLYEILVDFQLSEIKGDFTAIGGGSSFSLGALYATNEMENPENRIKLALCAAGEFCSSVGEPFTIEKL